MQKIAIVIPSLFGGGAEKAAVTISNGLNNHYEVYIIALEIGKSYDLEKNVVYIKLTNLHCKAGKSIKLLYFPYQLFKLKMILNEINPDVVISFMERTSFMLHLIRGNKNIYSFHNYMSFHLYKEHVPFPLKFLRNFVYKSFLKNMHKSAKYCVTMSKEAMIDLKKNFQVKSDIDVIYYPFDIKKIINLSSEKSKYDELFNNFDVLINIGRLEKQKGQWYLLRIFKELKKERTCKLVILGEGSLKKYLIDTANYIGLSVFVEDNTSTFTFDYDVYFLGFQKNPFRFIRLSKLFVFTSLWEGFPNILVEAIACSKTIITTDCHSGPRELLEPGSNPLLKTKIASFAKYGILMPNLPITFMQYKNPLLECGKIWVKTINYLLENKNVLEDYEKKALERAYEFNVNEIIDEWHKLIYKVHNE
jgi:glycosyltransferase involved in cell wall biosynthesis